MQNKPVTRQPLALLAKLAAVALAIFGMRLVRYPEAAELVVVVVAPGIALERVDNAVALQRAPKLASLLATGLIAEVPSAGQISGITFWRRVLASATPSPSQVGIGAEERPIWSALTGPSTAAGVPDILFPGLETAGGAGGAPAGSAFVGSSAPVAVTGADLRAAHLPAPFDALADRIKAAAGSVEAGKWSDWIDAGEGGAQRLQVFCASGDRCLLSPIYRTRAPEDAAAETDAADPVITTDPFLAAMEPDVRPAFVEHLVAIDDTRCAAVERKLATSRELRTAFYTFTVAATARQLFGKEAPDSSTDARVISVLDQRLARLATAAGERGLIVVIGGPGVGRETAGAAWLAVSSGQGTALGRVSMDAAGLASVLRYLLGVPLQSSERASLPAALSARYPHRAGTVADSGGAARPSRVLPWNVDSLETLLHVPGS